MMKPQPSIGLLPLYLKLYDDAMPQVRKEFEPMVAKIVAGLEAEGIVVVKAPICRVESECHEAVAQLEQEDVDLLVTLHLAYSPSEEVIEALMATSIPILMLDTTLDHAFGRTVHPHRIMFDHGIHGVQDLASVLYRRQKPFRIVAGHFVESPVLVRAAAIARAARGARLFRSTRALRIGPPFTGMLDFLVADPVLEKAFGIVVDQVQPDALASNMAEVTDEMVKAEVDRDRKRFVMSCSDEVHRRSVQVGLGLRVALKKGSYTAFSMNFMAFQSSDGPVSTVPFLEVSKCMSRGYGYAGEGDILTAALVGALIRAFGKTTFTEIFCPDWKSNTLFLSHMGEFNPMAAGPRPRLCEKEFPWTPARKPAFLACAPAPGPAVLANLAPGPNDTFRLLVAPVEVQGDASLPEMLDQIRGWIRPATGTIETFLERYSRLGGTHHSALVLGDRAEAVMAFGEYLGVECHLV